MLTIARYYNILIWRLNFPENELPMSILFYTMVYGQDDCQQKILKPKEQNFTCGTISESLKIPNMNERSITDILDIAREGKI